ncbi:malate synthase A [uncultured Algimonas sp.]|uniref:malate synthase A n=1 Tax=uncultured Algimonas sp. TaxID=1547920 RepID=UPI002631F322|nr:malate synthase A [uncultured Algimonas sp.]
MNAPTDTTTTAIPRHRVLAKMVGPDVPEIERVLTPDALLFLADLERRFGPQRKILLSDRQLRQDRYDDGELPGTPPETQHIRNSAWEVDPAPAALTDRRVEITGPVDRKMMINALNSGATQFMADFEDASSPTFANMVEGQANMIDYTNGDLTLETDRKSYAVGDDPATLLVRPRGWHLEEKNVTVDGAPMSASLFDFGLFFFHNGVKLAGSDRGPFFYLPKMESYQEARLWNDVFNFAQAALGVENGTIKCTVLIETLPAAFQMEEILYVLRRHITGLNCGRWDYIFSYIKTLRNHKRFVLPDRAQVGMDRDFLRAYSLRLIDTCHRRGAHAMGGMAAQIPVKNDDAANDAAFAKIAADKDREVRAGHDGTWVAHPAMVATAREAFDAHMPGKHQIKRQRQPRKISDEAMLEPHEGTITEAGLRTNIEVGIRYIAAWLSGRGAVPIHGLMEDAATAEISRAQVWQWLRHGADVRMEDGTTERMSGTLYRRVFDEVLTELETELGDGFAPARFPEAARLFTETATSADLPEFLTIPAYDMLET